MSSSATSKPMPPAPTIATRLPATLASLDDLDVARDLGMIDAGNRRRARHDAGGENHVVERVEILAPTRRFNSTPTPSCSSRVRK